MRRHEQQNLKLPNRVVPGEHKPNIYQRGFPPHREMFWFKLLHMHSIHLIHSRCRSSERDHPITDESFDGSQNSLECARLRGGLAQVSGERQQTDTPPPLCGSIQCHHKDENGFFFFFFLDQSMISIPAHRNKLSQQTC